MKSKKFIRKIILYLVVITAVGYMFHTFKLDNEAREQRYEEFKISIDSQYNDAVSALSNSEYSIYTEKELLEFKGIFSKFDNPTESLQKEIEDFGQENVWNVIKEYPNARILHIYVNALELQNGTSSVKRLYKTNAEQYEAAVKEIDKIPETYNGVLANKIKKDREYLKAKAVEARQLMEAAQAEENAILHIGDPEYKIEQIYGPPIKINTDISANNEHNQYVYADKFIYTDNGRVTNFQTR